MTIAKAEVAFGYGPESTTPVFTDISPYLLSATVDRGRTYELDRVETGTATLTLDNSDGRFTPGRRFATPDFYEPFATSSGLSNVTVDHTNLSTTNAPTFRAGASGTGTAGTAQITIPATVQVGDTLLMFVGVNDATGTFTTPSGWTSLVAENAGIASTSESYAYRRVAQAGDAGAVVNLSTSVSGKISASVVAYTGTATPVAQFALLLETVDRITHPTPTLTLGASDVPTVIVSAVTVKSGALTTITEPASYTIRTSIVGTGAGRNGTAVADKTVTTAATYGGESWSVNATANSSAAVGFLVALQPITTTTPSGTAVYDTSNGGCVDLDAIAHSGGYVRLLSPMRPIPPRGLERMRGSVRFKANTSSTVVETRLVWFDNTDTNIGVDFTQSTISPFDGWQLVQVEPIPPVNAVKYQLAAYLRCDTTVTKSTLVDDMKAQGISAYWQNVIPACPVRIMVNDEVGGSDKQLFRGFVEQWNAPVDGTNSDVTTVRCVDTFSRLAHVKIPRYYRLRVLKNKPTYYWPMDEASGGEGVAYPLAGGSTTLIKKNGSGGAAGLGTFGGTGVIAPGDGGSYSYEYIVKPDNLGNPIPDTATYLWQTGLTMTVHTSWSVEWWVNLTDPDQPGVLFELNSGYLFLKVYRSGTGQWTFRADDKNNAANNVSVNWNETMGNWDRVHVVLTGNGANLKCYVNGTLRASPVFPVDRLMGTGGNGTVGFGGSYNTTAGPFTSMHIGHGALYPTALSDDEIQNHWDIGRNVYTARESKYINHVLEYAGMSGWADVEVGDSFFVQPTWADDSNALDECLQLAEWAGGILYTDRTGTIRFEPRSARNSPTLAAVFDSEGVTSPKPGLEFANDVDRIYTRFEGHRGEYWRQYTTNDAAVTLYGLRVLDIDRPFSAYVELTNCVNWYSANYSSAFTRCDDVEFDAHIATALHQLLEALDVNDYIRLDRLPDNAPDHTMSFFVEGLHHDIQAVGAQTTWVVTLNLSPAYQTTSWSRT